MLARGPTSVELVPFEDTGVTFSVAQAARLLGLTPQGVEKRVVGKAEGLRWDASAPRRLERAGVVREARKRFRELTSDLAVLQAEGRRFEVDLEEGSRGQDPYASAVIRRADELQAEVDQLRSDLESERRGRAVAEARIDDLKRQLRQTNDAIRTLQPQPDANLDTP